LASIENDTRLAKIGTFSLVSNGSGKITATLLANYYYVPGTSIDSEYQFNNGVKNKEDMFKE